MNNVIEIREKLIISAHLKIEDCIPSLSQLIGYRQRVAQEILNKEGGCTDAQLNDLWTMWHYVNCDINKILGL
jgi:hypothetical protein